MKIQRTYDKDLIESVIFRDDIFDCISEDGFSKDEFFIDFDSNIFLLVSVGKEVAGIYILESKSSSTMEIHANIFKEYRSQYSIEISKEVLKWFIDNTDKIKLTASVPVKYMNVVSFCIKNGFSVEGCNRMSYVKNGVVYDQVNLGSTRSEIRSFIDGIS